MKTHVTMGVIVLCLLIGAQLSTLTQRANAATSHSKAEAFRSGHDYGVADGLLIKAKISGQEI